jgi:hypothetical protein
MVSGSSKLAVYAALAGNLAIAVIKFAAALFTGSSATLSEAIHSVVDTGNQALLLYGMHRAALPANLSDGRIGRNQHGLFHRRAGAGGEYYWRDRQRLNRRKIFAGS